MSSTVLLCKGNHNKRRDTREYFKTLLPNGQICSNLNFINIRMTNPVNSLGSVMERGRRRRTVHVTNEDRSRYKGRHRILLTGGPEAQLGVQGGVSQWAGFGSTTKIFTIMHF